MKQALLIIDVQNDYFENGKLPLFEPEKALEKINILEKTFKEKGLPIIYVQHVNEIENAPFFEIGTKGVELRSDLNVTEESIIIEKQYPNSFLGTDLLEILQELKVDQLVITGMMTHMCIDSTTRASSELNFKPILISNATATRDLMFKENIVSVEEVQQTFLSSLEIFSKVVTSEEFLEN